MSEGRTQKYDEAIERTERRYLDAMAEMRRAEREAQRLLALLDELSVQREQVLFGWEADYGTV